jgi:tRNA(adenine34) deaminase
MDCALAGDEVGSAADEVFMGMAWAAARRAERLGEVPVGAVLVYGGAVVARAHNAPVSRNDPTAHAEVLALRLGARAVDNYRLLGSTVYVTVEPCLMCVGALVHARVRRVVFGCPEPRAGALGSVYDVGRDGRGNHRLEVRGGVCADEARALLRRFFAARRGA